MRGSESVSRHASVSVAETSSTDAAARLYVVSAPRGIYVQVVKPLFDRTVALVMLLVTLPVMAVCALAVRISLGRDIFFRQVRVGRDGRLFTVLKFRTMHHDRRAPRSDSNGPASQMPATSDVEPFSGADRRVTHKSPHDPRLTGVGRFLRKWSLDELPQLWNVLRGDMSIIGPRPELPQIVEQYSEWENARHMVKPGLTGLWQVTARGEGLPMHHHVGVDVEYVAGLSAWLDLRILVRTPLALLTERGH